jgi:hypothetical protein
MTRESGERNPGKEVVQSRVPVMLPSRYESLISGVLLLVEQVLLTGRRGVVSQISEEAICVHKVLSSREIE